MVFDDFIDSQNVSYTLLKNSVAVDKLSHAYLINSNHNENSFSFVLAFIKMILCDFHYSNCSYSECKNCNKCKRIDDGNYPDIRIIESDSLTIKKEQLLELQDDFSKSSFEGGYRFYIIKDCDKMNKQASNSLLKFLEEPSDGIIAFLLTDNINNILSTIISRCQLIRLNHFTFFSGNSSLDNFYYLYNNISVSKDVFVSDNEKLSFIDGILHFIDYFEENGLDVLIYTKDLWYNIVQSREDYVLAFQLMINFYYDVLKFKLDIKNYFFCDKVDLIKKIVSYNEIDSIVKKIDILQYGCDMLLCNLNVNLLLDDIIIRLGDVK